MNPPKGLIKPVKVISRDCLPTNPPIIFTCVVYLMLDKFNAEAWVQGAIWTVMVFLWICAIIAMINQKVATLKFED